MNVNNLEASLTISARAVDFIDNSRNYNLVDCVCYEWARLADQLRVEGDREHSVQLIELAYLAADDVYY